MKTYLLAAACFLCLQETIATNYYLANAGNDTLNTGHSAASPWKSIAKLNTVSYLPGDSVFLKSGEVFRGTIIVTQGGMATSRVVFTAYGTGNKPIVSGAEPVSNWILNGAVYQATFNGAVSNFFVNDKEQIIARFPNEHQYLTLDSAGTNHLLDASITSLSVNDITGAKLCIHTAQWCWEKTALSSVSADRINYTGPTTLAALAGYSYFLYDNISHLDTAKEWKYDAANQTLNYIPPSNIDPNTLVCEASVYTNGFEFGSFAAYISILNIAFEKQANAGVAIQNANNKYIVIDNCNFGRQYNYGVLNKGKYTEVGNCHFREVDGIGVLSQNAGIKATIHHNVFKNIGQFRNSGIGLQINLSAINCAFVDSCYIHHNDIDSAGYCGISVDGAHNLIERNIIKNAMLLNNDGAALKSYGGQSHDNIFRNNFISHSDGNTEGCQNANFITPGIYFDFNVNNTVVDGNTIYKHHKKGIFQNSGNFNNTITNNVVYGGQYCLDLNGTPAQTTPITGMTIKHNSLFALSGTDVIIRQIDFSNAFNQGDMDSNYYFQPYNAANYAFRYLATTPTYYNFNEWQATGNDAHTQSSFVNWTLAENYSRLFMNQTDSVLSISLADSLYLDLDSNEVCGNLTLLPHSRQAKGFDKLYCKAIFFPFSAV